MTDSIQVEVRNACDGVSYRVEMRGGCVLAYGAIPVSDMVWLSKRAGRGAVMSADLARLAGATLACGSRRNVEALKTSMRPAAIAAAKASHPHLEDGAAEWLGAGEHGASAATMFYRLLGVKPEILRNEPDPWAYPLDPDDFRRCRLLLEQVPSIRPRLGEMRELSPSWAALVGAWEDLCATMDAECPQWRDGRGVAHETYRKMTALRA